MCPVCEGVDLPSDYAGIVYVKYDEGGNWRMPLASEMKAAGLMIGPNFASFFAWRLSLYAPPAPGRCCTKDRFC